MPGQPRDWAPYNAAQLSRGPRPLCTQVLDLAGPGSGRLALDLGCGAGVETRAMLDGGWRVHAVDSDPSMPGLVSQLTGDHEALSTCVSALEDATMPRAELIHASYALPFVRPEAFPATWTRLRDALTDGAWLAITLFGDRDSWSDRPDMTFHSRAAVESLLTGLDVVTLDEEDEDGPAFSGPKHWHVFHVTARDV